MKRIPFLDGFRGLAIVLVVLYHAYVRWANVVPYGDGYADSVILKNGFLGVQLFFLISGFVILMTLEKSTTLVSFLKRRWLRLFPAMLVATVFVFITAQFLPERPNGIPGLNSVIPGLLLMEPSWVHMLSTVKVGLLEGAFWSLFVEVKFYIVFGILYFWLGKYKAIAGIFACYAVWLVAFLLSSPGMPELNKYTNFIIFHMTFLHFGWFASGALAYLYFTTKKNPYGLMALAAGLLSAVSLHKSGTLTMVMACGIAILFLAVVYFEVLQKIIANRTFLFFGFISYPLYLIHENTMIALIIKMDKYFIIPHILLPVIPILILMAVAYGIAKWAEPLVLKVLKSFSFFH